MKYLQKSFTVAVSSPGASRRLIKEALGKDGLAWADRKRHEYEAKVPHEFLGASMCLVCGLGPKAKIHEL